ncbi:MAG TPA: hypothetical protein VG755_25925 [Nannocystaceae bacterium]|nr:hypothetical protein [Nannocystaceae bacterium]
MSKLATLGISLSLLTLAACPADDDTDTGADESSGSATTASTTATTTEGMTMSSTSEADTSTGDIDPSMCLGAGGAGAPGDACAANDECASGVCLIFTDVPLNADATCGDTPPVMGAHCSTHITGTVFDFATRMPVEGASLKVAGALNAITNPAGATALASATSGADGRVDTVTDVPVNQAIAIIALVEGPGSFLTATGLASPAEETFYATGTGIHDLWLMPQASIDAWSTALMADPEVPADSLPLGVEGGVIGFVRDATGMPIAGAVVEPASADSGAIIRYVAADDTITADMTTDTGIFIIIGAGGTGEDFNATMGGSTIASGTAGTANNVVFTLILNAE